MSKTFQFTNSISFTNKQQLLYSGVNFYVAKSDKYNENKPTTDSEPLFTTVQFKYPVWVFCFTSGKISSTISGLCAPTGKKHNYFYKCEMVYYIFKCLIQ